MPMNNQTLRPRRKAAASGDPYWSQVALLLHFDGASGSTSFTDASASAIAVSANGNASIGTANGMSGGTSAYFDGSGDYASGSMAFDWDSDWTVEFWFLRNGDGTGQVRTVFQAGEIQSGRGGVHFYVDGSGVWSANNGFTAAISGGLSPLGQWIHVALVRSGGTNTLYVDGVSVGQSTQSFPVTLNGFSIGGSVNYGFYVDAYIDEFRVTSAARYTANFTPPTAPFPNG